MSAEFAEFADSFPATFVGKILILRIVNSVAGRVAKRRENSANSAPAALRRN